MISKLLFYVYLTHILCYWGFSFIWNIYNTYPYNKKESIKVIKYVIKIQITILPICGFIFYYFYNKLDHTYILSHPTFSMSELSKLILMVIWEDGYFYYIHRLFHTRYLYKFHILHHKWQNPIPWEALYASRTENILLNFFPVLTAPLLFNLQIFYIFLWVIIATVTSLFAHTNDTLHSIHHKYRNVNYGLTLIFDRINGTYKLE